MVSAITSFQRGESRLLGKEISWVVKQQEAGRKRAHISRGRGSIYNCEFPKVNARRTRKLGTYRQEERVYRLALLRARSWLPCPQGRGLWVADAARCLPSAVGSVAPRVEWVSPAIRPPALNPPQSCAPRAGAVRVISCLLITFGSGVLLMLGFNSNYNGINHPPSAIPVY